MMGMKVLEWGIKEATGGLVPRVIKVLKPAVEGTDADMWEVVILW
jgi:hypothetical protein